MAPVKVLVGWKANHGHNNRTRAVARETPLSLTRVCLFVTMPFSIALKAFGILHLLLNLDTCPVVLTVATLHPARHSSLLIYTLVFITTLSPALETGEIV